MELKDYRKRMDRIDEELVRLFQERMKVLFSCIEIWQISQ